MESKRIVKKKKKSNRTTLRNSLIIKGLASRNLHFAHFEIPHSVTKDFKELGRRLSSMHIRSVLLQADA